MNWGVPPLPYLLFIEGGWGGGDSKKVSKKEEGGIGKKENEENCPFLLKVPQGSKNVRRCTDDPIFFAHIVPLCLK